MNTPRTLAAPRGLGLAAVGALAALGLILAAVRMESPWVLLAPVGLAAIPVLGLRLITRPAFILAAFLLLSANLDFFKLGETEISLHILFSSLFLWALTVRLVFEKRTPLGTPVEILYAAFLVLTFVSVLLSVDPARSIKNWFRDFEYLVLLSFLLVVGMTWRDRRLVAGAVVLSSIIPCLTALAGALFGVLAFSWLDTPIPGGEIIRRVSGTFSHPVSLSLYLAVTGTVTLSLILDGRWFRRTYLVPLFGLQLAVLYLTFGRTGWIAFFVGLVALLILSGRKRWIFMGIPAFLGAVAVALPTFVARWQSAFGMETDNSFLWRLGLWAYTATLIPQRPWFGSGQDTFVDYVAYGPGKPSHQTWLGLALETGLVGAVTFLCLVIAIVVALRRRMRHPAWRRDPLDQAAVAVFAGILVASLAENPFKVPVIITLVWALLGMTLSDRVERTPSENP